MRARQAPAVHRCKTGVRYAGRFSPCGDLHLGMPDDLRGTYHLYLAKIFSSVPTSVLSEMGPFDHRFFLSRLQPRAEHDPCRFRPRYPTGKRTKAKKADAPPCFCHGNAPALFMPPSACRGKYRRSVSACFRSPVRCARSHRCRTASLPKHSRRYPLPSRSAWHS